MIEKDNVKLNESLELHTTYKVGGTCKYFITPKDVNELIYCIESILNNGDSMDDLEWVSENLSEYNYYANTNK